MYNVSIEDNRRFQKLSNLFGLWKMPTRTSKFHFQWRNRLARCWWTEICSVTFAKFQARYSIRHWGARRMKTVIKKILQHLGLWEESQVEVYLKASLPQTAGRCPSPSWNPRC